MERRILIIDDDRTVCSSLSLLLKKNGYVVDSVNYPQQVMDKLNEFTPDLIILDMNFTIETTGKQGLLLLRRIREAYPQMLVILMTGWATLQLAVEGMKLGAKDFIAKPWDNKQLLSSIDTCLSLSAGEFSKKPEKTTSQSKIIGQNATLLEVLDMAHRVAPTEASVLILGDSGTGKELIAEEIHLHSKRNNESFVKVNLGGISSSLFESEMFGHAKGAFTDASADRVGRFEKAHGGTIFLDEIGDLALQSQVKLLRVLQEKQYEVLGSSKTVKSDARVISATNKNLETMVHSQEFREDLFYRINLITLRLPALAERRDDIPLLIRHFVNNLREIYDLDIMVADDAYEWMKMQQYPGNIRQLKNIVERTILLAGSNRDIHIKDFQSSFTATPSREGQGRFPGVGVMSLEEMEKNMIIRALEFHNFNISKAAVSLGISRNALYRRMEKYDISHEH